jgi:uncharacterized protein (TIGR03790 family)
VARLENRAVKRAAWLLLVVAGLVRAADDPLAARVILLANSDDPDSLRIARHYAEVRAVPPANIIALKMPVTETITWHEFIAAIWQPLVAELVRTKWIDAIPMTLADPVGRQKYAPFGHRIAALVVCRGVPLKIGHDASLYTDVPPFTGRAEFRTNAGAVDAELSLLALPNYPINAFVPNPLFQNERPASFELGQIVKVARLDGPTAEAANALVDRAVLAEKTGLLGRAYVDFSERDHIGNGWLEATANQLTALGFDPVIDRDGATFRASARFDAPALYFGWYASDLDGPFNLPGFQFPPGAIALHIHSYSAATLRSATTGWTGPLVARGVTATVGNVHEPYLQLTHRPDLLLRALARGANLIDAAYYALTALSWQAIVIGDPLYRPFGVPLEAQIKASSPFAPYAVLRQMNLLEADRQGDEAIALARSAQASSPSLALGLALARRLHAAGESEAAASALGFAAVAKTFPANEWGLAREAAQWLESTGRSRRALEIWQALLGAPTLPTELRTAWLPEARQAALAAKDEAQAEAWQREIP